MSTLSLRLAAPLQVQRTDSKLEVGRTNREPSKSGVTGLLAAALGLGRNVGLSGLSALRFGVRIDRNGEIIKDFHMAKAEETSYLTYRYYLSDAVFLVGSESEDRSFLERVENALRNLCFLLFLGKCSCPPALPSVFGIREDVLETALRRRESRNKDSKSIQQSHHCIHLDYGVAEQEGAAVQNLPISFNPMKRGFGYRRTKEIWLRDDVNTEESAEEHDAMAKL